MKPFPWSVGDRIIFSAPALVGRQRGTVLELRPAVGVVVLWANESVSVVPWEVAKLCLVVDGQLALFGGAS